MENLRFRQKSGNKSLFLEIQAQNLHKYSDDGGNFQKQPHVSEAVQAWSNEGGQRELSCWKGTYVFRKFRADHS